MCEKKNILPMIPPEPSLAGFFTFWASLVLVFFDIIVLLFQPCMRLSHLEAIA